jgi:hypothetical protein
MDARNFGLHKPGFACSKQELHCRRMCIRRSWGTILCSLIVGLVLPTISVAQSVLLDDAHTSTAPKTIDSNFGTNPNLFVNSAGNVYVKFKLSSTLPAGTPGSAVERATLKLYLANVTTAGKLDVYTVAGPWDEVTITGRNGPALGGLLTTTTQITLDKRNEFLVIDITALVQQWLGDDGQGTNGIPNHGLAIVSHPVDGTTPEIANITFDSKENSQTSHEAQLNIQLDGSVGGLNRVEHDTSLTGDGTVSSPLGVANGGITNSHLANDAVTADKIADNAVNSSELSDGAVTSPKISAPLSLTSADPNFTLSAANTGTGPAITAIGAIDTSTQYNLGSKRVLSGPGTNNFFAGIEAGTSNTTGTANAFFGKNAGQANSTGSFNAFVGNNAGAGNTTGQSNSFFGDAAGFRNADAHDNAFFGTTAGFRNTASNNSFFGSRAGFDNATGSDNSFFGSSAGTRNTTGGDNSFFGFFTGRANTSGFRNSYFGSFAGVNGSTGQQNSFFGSDAGFDNRTGSSNSFFGDSAGKNNQTGGVNSFFGASSGFSNISGQFNSFFGVVAGHQNTTGGSNAFFGYGAGLNNKTGESNTFVGMTTGGTNLAGSNLTLIGTSANVGVDNLSYATAIGAGAVVNTSNTLVLGRSFDSVQVPGALNVAGTFAANTLEAATQFNIGGNRILSMPGQDNLFLGLNAGIANTTGFSNAFAGNGAGRANTSGNQNSFFGQFAGFLNTTGFSNSFLGTGAGDSNTSGFRNSFLGVLAGADNTTGSGNVFLGFTAGALNTTGSNNTILGNDAHVGAVDLNFATAIGSGALVSTSNTLVLGRNADTVQVPGTLNVAGSFGANILNAGTRFDIGGNRVLSVSGGQFFPNTNVFAGVGAGALTTPSPDTFAGNVNAFFGESAGAANTTGHSNAFFGSSAGFHNTSGADNAFFGRVAGFKNTTGGGNTFAGTIAGENNTTGNANVFVGFAAGFANNSGTQNTGIGSYADVGAGFSNATAIGYGAKVSQSNSLVLGSIAASGYPDTNIGIGTTTPRTKLHLAGGKIYVEANGQGVILKAPGGACFELTVTDAGTLATAVVACP